MPKHAFKIQTEKETHFLNNKTSFLKTLSALIAENESYIEASFLQSNTYKTILFKGVKRFNENKSVVA